MGTYEIIAAANSTIKTTDIKGREYAQVNERIKAFRMVYPSGRILTEMLSDECGRTVFRASVYAAADDARPLGTGHAYERENDERSMVNQTSYIENCETSAVGRALAMCGFGIEVSIASAEELAGAIERQKTITPEQAETLSRLVEEMNRMQVEHNLPEVSMQDILFRSLGKKAPKDIGGMIVAQYEKVTAMVKEQMRRLKK